MQDTVAEVLARLMELGMDKLTIRQEGEIVDVICYVYNFTGSETQESVSCTDDDIDVTSIMWDLPFGQSFSIEIGLDFDLDSGGFPLEISFGGDVSTPHASFVLCIHSTSRLTFFLVRVYLIDRTDQSPRWSLRGASI